MTRPDRCDTHDMQRQRRRAPLEAASAPEPGQASVLLADRTRESVAEELVRRGRRVIAPLELWLLDRADMRLHRPDLGGLQPPAEVQLDASEPLRSWPDTLRVPGPQPTAGLAAFAAMIGGRALGRVLRVGDETFGVIVATHRGPRAPVTLDRRLATVGGRDDGGAREP